MASKVSALRSFLSRLNTRLAMDGSDCEVEGSSSSAPWEDHFHEPASHLAAASDGLVADESLVRQTAHFPSLSLFGRGRVATLPVVTGARSLRAMSSAPSSEEFSSGGACNAYDAEKRAIRNLGLSIPYSVADIHSAPERMAGAVSCSFVTLVEANLRQYFKRRMIHRPESAATGDVDTTVISKARRYAAALLDIPSDSSDAPEGQCPTIRLKGFRTSFEPASGEAVDDVETDSCAPYSLPMKFKFEISLSNMGNRTALNVEAEGRIVGYFHKGASNRFDRIEVELNTSQLLRMMRQKARVVAWMTVASAEEQRALDESRVSLRLKFPTGLNEGPQARPSATMLPNLITPPGSPRYSPTLSAAAWQMTAEFDANLPSESSSSQEGGSVLPRRKRALVIATTVSRKKQHQEREKRT